MLKGFLYIFTGLVLGPFIWAFDRLGWIKPVTPIPEYFEKLIFYFQKQGLWASVEIQPIQINHAESVASLRFGLNPAKFLVVTLTKSASKEQAQLLEAEAKTAPQYTGVRRNGTLVMACTFSPPDPEFEARVSSVFMAYSDIKRH